MMKKTTTKAEILTTQAVTTTEKKDMNPTTTTNMKDEFTVTELTTITSIKSSISPISHSKYFQKLYQE